MVLGAAGRASDRVDVELYIFESEPVEYVLGKADDLSVRGRSGTSRHFKSELVELAEPSRLRSLVAEAGDDVEYPLRKSLVEHSVLEHCTDSAGGALGTERELGLLSLYGIHLLLHYVRRLADRTQEKVGILEGGEAQLSEAVALSCLSRYLLHGIPLVYILRENVLGAVGALDVISHSFQPFKSDFIQ